MSDTDSTFRMPGSGEAAGVEVGEHIAPGTIIGDYAVLSLLATGGHGAVYVAEHRWLGRRAAVKVLLPDLAGSTEAVERFLREARAVNRIRHPNIVEIHDGGALPDGRPYCVMELLPGRSLSEIIRARGALAPAEAVAYLAPLCDALDAAHAAGVIHRDVKASNVLVASEGDPPVVKLLDFGIAKLAAPEEAGLTTVGERLGSTGAMSPEQIRGETVEARTDVYALGVLLHQMLTGHLPFEAQDPREIEQMHLTAEPPRPSRWMGTPPVLDAVVARAMAKVPERRFAGAGDLLQAARDALGAAARAELQRAPAVAVHVALAPASADPGDEDLVALASGADAVEGALYAAGFSLPLATASSVLAVRLLPTEPAARGAARAEAVSVAQALLERLSGLPLRVAVSVHAGEADVRHTSGGPEIAGGPVCRISEWVPDQAEGLHVSPAAAG
jgi:serine/threonine-protein kinase